MSKIKTRTSEIIGIGLFTKSLNCPDLMCGGEQSVFHPNPPTVVESSQYSTLMKGAKSSLELKAAVPCAQSAVMKSIFS